MVLKATSTKPAARPAPRSTATVQPKERNFFTVSGVAATRVSPVADSTGIKSLGKIKEWF
jgi:hypothetical protein